LSVHCQVTEFVATLKATKLDGDEIATRAVTVSKVTDFSTATVFNSGWSPGSGGGLAAESVVDLLPGLTYYWAIRARDPVALVGTWSRSGGVNANNFAPAWDEPPAKVNGVTAIAISSPSQVSLSWTDLTLAEKTTDFDFYRIDRSSDNLFYTSIATTVSSSFMDTTVLDGVTYYYHIVGVDQGVVSTPSFVGNALESVTFDTVTARVAISSPSNLVALSVATNSVTWQWTDNSSAESGFRIYSSIRLPVGSWVRPAR